MNFGNAAKVDYSYLVLSDYVLDKNCKMNLIYFFDIFKKYEVNNEKLHIRNI